MKTCNLLLHLTVSILTIALMVACAGSEPEPAPEEQMVAEERPVPTTPPITPTPLPPTRKAESSSCAEVEGYCLELTFDGESCTYEGPTALDLGDVTVLFLNESEVIAAAELLKLAESKTIQDLVDDIKERPTEHAPSWVTLMGMWGSVQPGDIKTRSLFLASGNYGLICGRIAPHHVWFGGALTVEQ